MSEKVEEKYTYTKLSGTANYRRWAVITKAILEEKEVWEVTDGTRLVMEQDDVRSEH